MCAMRIRKITGTIDLLWFYFAKKFNGNLYIFFTHRFFLNRSCFIKRKILKMNVLIFNTNIAASGFCFTTVLSILLLNG